jgi:hypothetical protein
VPYLGRSQFSYAVHALRLLPQPGSSMNTYSAEIIAQYNDRVKRHQTQVRLDGGTLLAAG